MSPTVVIVPGASQTPLFYHPLADALKKSGFAVEIVATPSVGASPGLKTYNEDVIAVRNTVAAIVENGGDVIVLMHSYGGMPGSAALRGLGKEERKKGDQSGGVIRLVYVCAYALREGESTPESGDLESMKTWAVVDEENWTVKIPKEAAMWSCFHDLPVSQGEYWYERFQTHSIGALWSPLQYAAWMHVPSTYVLCERDRVIPPTLQEKMIANAKEVTDTAFDCVERIDAGHEPTFSHVDDLVRVVRKAAE